MKKSVVVALVALSAAAAFAASWSGSFRFSPSSVSVTAAVRDAESYSLVQPVKGGQAGLTALACEVMWTKVLSLQFGATTYTFSLILAVFLTGLGIGSTIGASLASSVARPRVAFVWCQMLICGAMAWAASEKLAASSMSAWLGWR